MSLLELIIASTLLATVIGTVTVVLRTSRTVWQAREGDHTRIEAAQATMRHLVRRIRQATSVVSISTAADNSGALSVLMPSGDTYAWDHNGSTDQVDFGVTTASNVLAENVTKLTLTAYEADGVTTTTTVGDIQAIKIDLEVELERDSSGTRKFTSWAWVRAFD